jgi:hypothetical protein
MMEPATAMLTVGFLLGLALLPHVLILPLLLFLLSGACFFLCRCGKAGVSDVVLDLLSLLLLVFLPPDLLGVGGIHDGGGVGFRREVGEPFENCATPS